MFSGVLETGFCAHLVLSSEYLFFTNNSQITVVFKNKIRNMSPANWSFFLLNQAKVPKRLDNI